MLNKFGNYSKLIQQRVTRYLFYFLVTILSSNLAFGQVGSEGFGGVPENYIYGVDASKLLIELEKSASSDGFAILYEASIFDAPFISSEWGAKKSVLVFNTSSKIEKGYTISSIKENKICLTGNGNICVELFLGSKRSRVPGGIYCLSKAGTNFYRKAPCRFISYKSGKDGIIPIDLTGHCIYLDSRDSRVKAEPVRCGTGYVRRQIPVAHIVTDTGRWRADERFIDKLQ